LIKSPDAPASEAGAALVDLLNRLDDAGYHFVTPTPSTHRRVAARLDRARPGNLRDVFGWGRPFAAPDLEPALFDAMQVGGVLDTQDGLFRSAVRVSMLDRRLHLHSARGGARDAVFLGPDSYRFVRLLDAVHARCAPPDTALDIGAGAGAGALAVASRAPEARVTASDINPSALRYLTANAAHAGLPVDAILGSGPEAAPGEFDLIIANPPYVVDSEQRLYRDGGGALGTDLALAWVESGLEKLNPGGRFVLYTGSPIVEGRDLLKAEVEQLAARTNAALTYEELDPDVFGGMLAQDAYSQVERIAAVGAVLTL
jgi:methylase of polypeptide subunit release factors